MPIRVCQQENEKFSKFIKNTALRSLWSERFCVATILITESNEHNNYIVTNENSLIYKLLKSQFIVSIYVSSTYLFFRQKLKPQYDIIIENKKRSDTDAVYL